MHSPLGPPSVTPLLGEECLAVLQLARGSFECRARSVSDFGESTAQLVCSVFGSVHLLIVLTFVNDEDNLEYCGSRRSRLDDFA